MLLANYLEELYNWYGREQANDNCARLEIIKKIERNLGLAFLPENYPVGQGGVLNSFGSVCFADSPEVRVDYRLTFDPIHLLDYIYAVWHSPGYRNKKWKSQVVDHTAVPGPTNPEAFWKLVGLGGKLRKIHLLEGPQPEGHIATFPIIGSNKITAKIGERDWESIDGQNQLGRIWINEAQYFNKIPLMAWKLSLGGDRPAKKWLLDRRGHTLDPKAIRRFQQIIGALMETHLLVQEINSLKAG